MYKIPIVANSFTCRLDINGENRLLVFNFTYNSIADLWKLSLTDYSTQEEFLTNVPLLPFQDLLEQYKYKNLGSAVLIPNSNEVTEEYPSLDTLKDNYNIFWGDNDEFSFLNF